ncbi:hypothetical protein [Flavobacterium sp. 83]|jgi:hypothetical protein|uniref:hypothetical protein n=1 Tax=Flavobacterium sp. 83 TaxID=1131812 RepID=UPI0005558F86|nr:hypothetical protein [Flavobacterium sp. 83]
MRKIKLTLVILPFAIVLMNCNSTKKGTEYTAVQKELSYNKDIKPIIETSCTPCHIPPQGRKEPLENYIHVKENIGAIIDRVKLPQEDRKFMPPRNKKPALNDSLIAVLVKWQQQNMPE